MYDPFRDWLYRWPDACGPVQAGQHPRLLAYNIPSPCSPSAIRSPPMTGTLLKVMGELSCC